MIEIKAPDIKEVRKKLGGFQKKAPTVIARVINRVATNVKSNMAKDVVKRYIVKSGDVKKTINVKKANKNSLGALVYSKSLKMPLYDFKVSPNKPKPNKPPKFYKAKVLKSSGLKSVLGGFVAKMQSGHLGMFKRSDTKRLPIRELYGPSIPQMIGNEEVISNIQKEAMSTMEKRLDHEIKRILDKK